MRDPQCGMTLTPRSAAAELGHGGRIYYFCSMHCLQEFRSSLANRRVQTGNDETVIMSPMTDGGPHGEPKTHSGGG
jgi:YHS domain-containing protein